MAACSWTQGSGSNLQPPNKQRQQLGCHTLSACPCLLTLHPLCRPRCHQVPFTDGKPLFARNVAARGWVAIIRGLLGGLHDLLRGSVTYPPAYYPIAGAEQGHQQVPYAQM